MRKLRCSQQSFRNSGPQDKTSTKAQVILKRVLIQQLVFLYVTSEGMGQTCPHIPAIQLAQGGGELGLRPAPAQEEVLSSGDMAHHLSPQLRGVNSGLEGRKNSNNPQTNHERKRKSSWLLRAIRIEGLHGQVADFILPYSYQVSVMEGSQPGTKASGTIRVFTREIPLLKQPHSKTS